MNFNDAHKLQGALSKIENYMAARDLSLGAVF
jgi:Ca2+-binding EF-hand superfamily protein